MTLSRMVRNHGLQLKEDEAHKILKHLADNYGLAPAEVTPFEYVLEERNSTLEGKDKAGLPPNVTGACVQCRSFARIGLQRRTPEMWKRLPDLHEYFVPFVASDTSSAGNLIEPWRQVATKEAVPYFIKRLPFETPAWTQWQAAPKPDYSGKWLVVAHDLARGGDYTGTLTVTSSGDDRISASSPMTSRTGRRSRASRRRSPRRSSNGADARRSATRGSGLPGHTVWPGIRRNSSRSTVRRSFRKSSIDRLLGVSDSPIR